jgi:hypothetical protein
MLPVAVQRDITSTAARLRVVVGSLAMTMTSWRTKRLILLI